MSTGTRRRAGGRLACAFIVLVCVAGVHGGEPVPAREELVLVSGAGKRFLFQVEIADSGAERRRGLMYREHLDETHGMLFLYRPARRVSIWMKNTPLPLDILFIDADGRIARIERNAVPLSEKAMSSGVPVRAVLEINGGMAEFLGIAAGDQVYYAPLWPESAP